MNSAQVYPERTLSHKCDSVLRRQKMLREPLFMLALITLPFSAQGIEPYGITLEVSYLCVLAFSLIYFWSIPPRHLDREDKIYFLFLFFAVISLGYNIVRCRVSILEELSGLRFSMRQLAHLFRFLLFYMIYKSFKEFLSTGDWVYRQHLFYKGLIAAAWIPALYGSYQFFAQRFSWPLASINNLHGVGAFLTPHYLDDLRGSFYTIIATFGEAKTYAGFLLGIIPLLMGIRATMKRETSFKSFLPVSKSSSKWLVVLIGTLIAHFALGFSRTAYITLVLLVLFIFLFISRKAALVICILVLIFLVGASLFMGKPPFSLLGGMWTSVWEFGDIGRKIIERWMVVLRYVKESPLLGYGLGNVLEEPIMIVTRSRVTLWFGAPGVLGQLLPGVGILGTVPFLVFLASHVWLSLANLRRLDRKDGLYSLLLFSLVAVVGAWTIRFIHFHANATMPWIVLAENVALNRVAERLIQTARGDREDS